MNDALCEWFELMSTLGSVICCHGQRCYSRSLLLRVNDVLLCEMWSATFSLKGRRGGLAVRRVTAGRCLAWMTYGDADRVDGGRRGAEPSASVRPSVGVVCRAPNPVKSKTAGPASRLTATTMAGVLCAWVVALSPWLGDARDWGPDRTNMPPATRSTSTDFGSDQFSSW